MLSAVGTTTIRIILKFSDYIQQKCKKKDLLQVTIPSVGESTRAEFLLQISVQYFIS